MQLGTIRRNRSDVANPVLPKWNKKAKLPDIKLAHMYIAVNQKSLGPGGCVLYAKQLVRVHELFYNNHSIEQA